MKHTPRWDAEQRTRRARLAYFLMGFARTYKLGQFVKRTLICDSCDGVGGWVSGVCGDCMGTGRKWNER